MKEPTNYFDAVVSKEKRRKQDKNQHLLAQAMAMAMAAAAAVVNNAALADEPDKLADKSIKDLKNPPILPDQDVSPPSQPEETQVTKANVDGQEQVTETPVAEDAQVEPIADLPLSFVDAEELLDGPVIAENASTIVTVADDS
ncbi:hypothetical protein TI03_03445, partial [Achromatium sp. WMS1]